MVTSFSTNADALCFRFATSRLAANLGFSRGTEYRDREYAREAARKFFDDLLASGTTTCQAFTSTWSVVTEEFSKKPHGVTCV